MVLRVVADTNVLVSAFHFGGRKAEVLDLAQDGAIELWIAQPILDELLGVLDGKFHWSAERLDTLNEILTRLCHLADPRESVRLCRDPDDDRVLECALAAGAGVIVSGDADLLDVGTLRGIPIMSPRVFLELKPWRRAER
jgi:putative PIN family toxin of toxin-antitoxin system